MSSAATATTWRMSATPIWWSYFADVSLSDWLARTPPALVARHLNVDVATIAKFPNDKPEIMPQ